MAQHIAPAKAKREYRSIPVGLAGALTATGAEAILMCVKPGGIYGEEKGQLKLSREEEERRKRF
jgi:hypothetical protein